MFESDFLRTEVDSKKIDVKTYFQQRFIHLYRVFEIRTDNILLLPDACLQSTLIQ